MWNIFSSESQVVLGVKFVFEVCVHSYYYTFALVIGFAQSNVYSTLRLVLMVLFEACSALVLKLFFQIR